MQNEQFKQQLRSTLVAAQWQGDAALTFWSFWQRSMASSVVWVGARGHAFTLSPHVPIPNRLPHLCGHKAKMFTYEHCMLGKGGDTMEQCFEASLGQNVYL